MLRPHFSRSQISDLKLEEVHVQNMMEQLPVDTSGWTAPVDLQVLFFRLTLDSSTDFLFGKSVGSQTVGSDRAPSNLPVKGVPDEIQFGKAFDRYSKWLTNRARINEAY